MPSAPVSVHEFAHDSAKRRYALATYSNRQLEAIKGSLEGTVAGMRLTLSALRYTGRIAVPAYEETQELLTRYEIALDQVRAKLAGRKRRGSR